MGFHSSFRTITIYASPATYRHRQELAQDGFVWISGKRDRWERLYDNNTYFKWANIMRREPGAGPWPVRRW